MWAAAVGKAQRRETCIMHSDQCFFVSDSSTYFWNSLFCIDVYTLKLFKITDLLIVNMLSKLSRHVSGSKLKNVKK